MEIQNRRLFLQSFAIGSIGVPLGLDLWGKDKNDPNRFQIGIQEYTFNRLLRSGKLKHLDYPALVEKVIDEVIATVGATTMKDMGKVMGMANKQLSGQADGKLIAEIVKKRLG